MTSQEAMAVVRAFFDLAAAGDFAGLAGTLDPDVVFLGTRGGLDEKRVLRGPEAVVEYVSDEITDPWERYEVEAERLIEVGDRVVAFLRETGQPRHGDLEMQSETAMTFKVRQHRIVEARGYLDRDEALRAARLAG
jgi:ketosteroid isomerase-like protein